MIELGANEIVPLGVGDELQGQNKLWEAWVKTIYPKLKLPVPEAAAKKDATMLMQGQDYLESLGLKLLPQSRIEKSFEFPATTLSTLTRIVRQ